MEDSQHLSSGRLTIYIREARNIEKLLTGISYGAFSDKEIEDLIFLTNYVRRIPSDEIENFRIKKYTEAWVIFRDLKNAFSERTLEQEMHNQLIKYERYEILTALTKL